MHRTRLKFRYVLTVALVGALLTGSVAITTFLRELREERHLREAIAVTDSLRDADPTRIPAEVSGTLEHLVVTEYRDRLGLIVAVGLALTILAAWITALLASRIDRAMAAVLESADRIGRGSHADPVQRSGVPELETLEESLERMRQALTGTTISRDYLNPAQGAELARVVGTSNGRVILCDIADPDGA